MSLERKTTTTLWCDTSSCLERLQWPVNLPKAHAERLASKEGWRKDKLGRNICSAHPKLKGAR